MERARKTERRESWWSKDPENPGRDRRLWNQDTGEELLVSIRAGHLCSPTSVGGCRGADINTSVGGKLEVEEFHAARSQFSLGTRRQSHLLTGELK